MQRETMRTRVKICGITREEDARAAVSAGVDALGFNFYPGSKRAISSETGARLCQILPPFVCKVGLFVNTSAEEVQRIMDTVPLDLLQFHGDETDDYCKQFNKQFMKAIRIDERMTSAEVGKLITDFPSAAALLLDTFVSSEVGGTGKSFDWRKVPSEQVKPLVVAGGLTVENVPEVIRMTKPYGVDLSGGVESQPGIKDAEKIIAFMQAVQAS